MVAKRSTGEAEKNRTQGREAASEMQAAGSDTETAHQRIAERAYRLYLDRGVEDGHALEDWLRAEQEVLGEES